MPEPIPTIASMEASLQRLREGINACKGTLGPEELAYTLEVERNYSSCIAACIRRAESIQ